MIRLITTVKPVFVATAGKGWAPFVMDRSLVNSKETVIAQNRIGNTKQKLNNEWSEKTTFNLYGPIV